MSEFLAREGKRIAAVIGALISIFATLATTVGVLVLLFGEGRLSSPFAPTPTPTPSVDISGIEIELTNLRDEVTALEQRVDAFSQNPQDIAIVSELAQIHSDFNSLGERIEVIERTVLDNPAKALELTLLSRDMETLQQSYQTDLQSTRAEISRIYDLNKWFLGLMFTMAIGVVSLAISNVIGSRPSKSDKNERTKSD